MQNPIFDKIDRLFFFVENSDNKVFTFFPATLRKNAYTLIKLRKEGKFSITTKLSIKNAQKYVSLYDQNKNEINAFIRQTKNAR